MHPPSIVTDKMNNLQVYICLFSRCLDWLDFRVFFPSWGGGGQGANLASPSQHGSALQMRVGRSKLALQCQASQKCAPGSQSEQSSRVSAVDGLRAGESLATELKL